MTSAVLERKAVHEAEEIERRWTPEAEAGAEVELREDSEASLASSDVGSHALPSMRSFRSATARWSTRQSTIEDDSARAAGSPIAFRTSTFGAREQNSRRLHSSLATLQRIISRRGSAEWLEAARVLKHDAVRMRNTHLARHSSVLLALADAMTFSDPDEQVMDARTIAPFKRAVALLCEPFISEAGEEEILIGLLESGWYLAPIVEPGTLGA